MSILEVLLLSVGLAMDAFSVSICKGLNMKKINFLWAVVIALFFGFFQFLMPVIGFYLGSQFEKYIINIDHWIIFVMLTFIGIKMILESIKQDDNIRDNNKNKWLELFILSIATSLDALAVGITFAFLQVNVFLSSSIIGVITFILSSLGVIIGNYFGQKFKKPAEITGGVILILIGLKILLEHLGVLII